MAWTSDELQKAIDSDDAQARMQLRALIRRSLYFTSRAVAGYFYEPNHLLGEVFKERQDWLQYVITDHKRGLLEDPRAHAKSGGSSIAIPIWLGVQRPDERYDHPNETARAIEFLQAHPHIKAADSQLVLLSDSAKRAAKFVGASLSHWASNPLLRWAFPELVWQNTNILPYGHWSKGEYSIPTRTNVALPDDFLRSAGLESKEQGGRADGIFVEDLVGETSWRSPNELMRRQDYVRTISNLLQNSNPGSPNGGFVLIIGNRWALDDVNSMVHNEFHHWEIWRRSAFRCVVHAAGNCGRWGEEDSKDNPCAPTQTPLWLQEYPNEKALAAVELDKGPEVFSAQWMNDPTRVADLDYRKFKPFTFDITPLDHNGEERRVWAIRTPVDATHEEIIPVSWMNDHIISIDPAGSKSQGAARTAISWIALDRATMRRFWIECWADRWNSDEATEAIYNAIKEVREKIGRWPRIVCEEVALQDYVGSSVRWFAKSKGVDIPRIEGVKPTRGDRKADRIKRRLSTLMGQDLLWLRAGLQLPRYETRHFPTGTLDALDSFAQTEDIFQGIHGTVDSEVLRKQRQRARDARLACADSAGVPL